MCKNVASSVMVMRGGRREVVAWDLAWDIHGDGACGASWGVWNLDKRRLLYLLVLEGTTSANSPANYATRPSVIGVAIGD
jgi:hypothetical protein